MRERHDMKDDQGRCRWDRQFEACTRLSTPSSRMGVPAAYWGTNRGLEHGWRGWASWWMMMILLTTAAKRAKKKVILTCAGNVFLAFFSLFSDTFCLLLLYMSLHVFSPVFLLRNVCLFLFSESSPTRDLCSLSLSLSLSLSPCCVALFMPRLALSVFCIRQVLRVRVSSLGT